MEDILIYENLALYDEEIKKYILGLLTAQETKIKGLEARIKELESGDFK